MKTSTLPASASSEFFCEMQLKQKTVTSHIYFNKDSSVRENNYPFHSNYICWYGWWYVLRPLHSPIVQNLKWGELQQDLQE